MDQEVDATREKVLDAAGQVFAETGFANATIRQICSRAGVNVASVNYHFRDKLGLYEEVLRHSVCSAESNDVANALAACKNPEDGVRLFIHRVLQLMLCGGRSAWYVRLMTHELAQPTPALASVVENVIRPKHKALATLVGAIIGADPASEDTRLCVHSLLGQMTHYAHGRAVLSLIWPELSFTPERVESIADHIAEFSVAGLRAKRDSLKRRERQQTKRGAQT